MENKVRGTRKLFKEFKSFLTDYLTQIDPVVSGETGGHLGHLLQVSDCLWSINQLKYGSCNKSFRKGVVQWLRGPNFSPFWPPPTQSGETWTFKAPSTLCSRGQFQNPPLYRKRWYKIHFSLTYEGIRMVMARMKSKNKCHGLERKSLGNEKFS